MIKAMEQLNCSTTNILRGNDAVFPTYMFPFKTFTGLKDERYNAGLLPATSAVTITQHKTISQKVMLENGMLILLPVSALKAGNANCTNNTENINAIKVRKKDSAKN